MISAENTADEAPPSGLVLVDYVRIGRRYWKGIVAFTLAGILIAFGWSAVQPRIFASDSSGIIIAGGGDNLGLSLAGDNLAKSKAKNYKSLAESRLVADRVIESLGLESSATDLLASVSVTVPPETAEIQVTARSLVPEDAQRIANAWVLAFAAQINEVESQSITTLEGVAPGSAAVKVLPLGQAVVPDAPVSPNVRTALLIGLLAGLALGVIYALLRNHLDRRMRDASEIERLFGVPVIGTIPVDQRLEGKSSVLDGRILGTDGTAGRHAIAEALRELRTNLQFIDVDNPPKIIVVTSSVPSEGKSTVTANLAVTMAAAGENVVVVDGDLRRPTVVDVFGLVPGVGVTDVLSGHAEISDVLQTWSALPNLHVLGSGRIPPNPSELLGSRAMKSLLRTLSEDAVVLIDAPPLLPVTDAAVLSRIADGCIVIVRSGRTTQDELGRSLGNLKRVKGHVLGVILNRIQLNGSKSYGYYGSYTSAEPATIDTEPGAGSAPPSHGGVSEFEALITGQPPEAVPFAPSRRRSSSR